MLHRVTDNSTTIYMYVHAKKHSEQTLIVLLQKNKIRMCRAGSANNERTTLRYCHHSEHSSMSLPVFAHYKLCGWEVVASELLWCTVMALQLMMVAPHSMHRDNKVEPLVCLLPFAHLVTGTYTLGTVMSSIQ